MAEYEGLAELLAGNNAPEARANKDNGRRGSSAQWHTRKGSKCLKGKQKMKLINQHSLLINAFLRREPKKRGIKSMTVRLPVRVREILVVKARREDLNFSQLVRRALRRELVKNAIPINADKLTASKHRHDL
jgi:hypothetical protein